MAGIAGILDTSMLTGQETLLSLARAMSEQAPGSGQRRTDVTADETTGIALAATGISDAADPARLTAIARSASGRYLIAMTGANGRWTSLRRALDRVQSEQPAATLIAASVEELGIARTLALSDGPLALAVWDRAERTLTIGRDCYGQEILFAAWAGSSFIFGSHLFSLVTHPQFRREIDRGGIAQYLRHAHFSSPQTPFEGAVRLKPGAMTTIKADRPGAEIVQIPAASIREDAQFGLEHRFTGTPAEAVDAIESALHTAFREATADASTPIGIFFSGGIDSTLLAAVAASTEGRPVHAITAGFTEAAYDESEPARMIAKHLGIEHQVIPFTADDARDLMPRAAEMYQEPFGDTAALPTILLAEAASTTVPVIVTGDGGDELFMGKPDDMLWNARKWFPGPLRPMTANALDLFAAGAERTRGVVDRFVPRVLARYLRPTRIRKAAAGLHVDTAEGGMDVLYADTLDQREFFLNPRPDPETYYEDRRQWLNTPDQEERWRYIGILGYTLDREIPKHQRAITASGVAFRSVLFHSAVAKLAWSLPPKLRDYDGRSRALVRDVVARHVPQSLFEREKSGFDVPFDLWFRGPLRDIGEDLLGERRLREDGILNPAAVRREWEQHLSGKHDRRYILYDLIAFQLWLDRMKRVAIAK
jgi:asparagine synthase (glutamine-hydrolysing)